MSDLHATALVLFSGGQDSTTCLAHALRRYQRVETLGFHYGQRHHVEMQARLEVLSRIAAVMPEVGERYLGTVVKTTTFGAFVSLMPGKDGLLHISEIKKLAPGKKRIENVEEVLKVGDKLQVEIKEIDPRGKLSLIPVVDSSEQAAPADA